MSRGEPTLLVTTSETVTPVRPPLSVRGPRPEQRQHQHHSDVASRPHTSPYISYDGRSNGVSTLSAPLSWPTAAVRCSSKSGPGMRHSDTPNIKTKSSINPHRESLCDYSTHALFGTARLPRRVKRGGAFRLASPAAPVRHSDTERQTDSLLLEGLSRLPPSLPTLPSPKRTVQIRERLHLRQSPLALWHSVWAWTSSGHAHGERKRISKTASKQGAAGAGIQGVCFRHTLECARMPRLINPTMALKIEAVSLTNFMSFNGSV